ncbi:50S ribosomal protein L28, partial [Lactiplantibacillus plantarum]
NLWVTGKRTHFGNTLLYTSDDSHDRCSANLHEGRILVDGKPKKVWISARTLKSGKVTRV